MRKSTTMLFTAALVLTACSTTKDEEAGDTTPAAESTTAPETTSAPETTTAESVVEEAADTTVAADDSADTTAPVEVEAPSPTFPPVVDDRAPGVTDTSIKIGIMYLDLSEAGPVLGINQGDFQAAYQAAIDEVNEAGGIHGRMIEAVFTPIVPASADQGTAACTALTDDEEVFVVLGSYIDENAPCVVTTHETPLLGGDLAMNPDTMAAAKALWFAVGGGAGQQNAGLQTLVDEGLLDGKVGVVGALGFESLYEINAQPILEAGGVDVVDVAYLDIINGAADPNSLYAAAETVALKFESQGIDQVIFNTGGGTVFPSGLARTDYRPRLLFDNSDDMALYIAGEGNDLSVLENAIAVGSYDAANLFPEMGGKAAECVASQEKRLGITIIPSKDVPKGEPTYWASSSVACDLVGLLTKILDAAGPELNWGTFTTAGYNLGPIELATSIDPYVFDKDHPNGSPKLYFYEYDAASESMRVVEG